MNLSQKVVQAAQESEYSHASGSSPGRSREPQFRLCIRGCMTMSVYRFVDGVLLQRLVKGVAGEYPFHSHTDMVHWSQAACSDQS